MRIEDLTPDVLRRVFSIYLDQAWPGREKEKMPKLSPEAAGADLLAGFTDESARRGGSGSRRYALRLGNMRYAHMKLVLEEQLVAGLFIFLVDTHDPDIRPDFPDYEGWQALKEHNRRLKERIELGWHSAGLHTAQSLEELVPAAGAPGPAGRAGRGIRVLLVDDQEYLLRSVAKILRQEDFDVVLARDGQEAVSLALRLRPPLVLMDYEMPRMNGVEAARAIRAAVPGSETRIILATAALIDLSSVREADGFLLKPYFREFLVSFLLAVLKHGGG
jgi:CheY-like chemotaxis protein